MGWIVCVWLAGAGGASAANCQSAARAERPLVRYEYTQAQMGVKFRILLYALDEASANAAAKAAFARVEQLNGRLSDFDPESELNKLCRTGGQNKAVPLSDDLWNVLWQSHELSQQTEGAFDVTVGPLVTLWRRARRKKKLPSAERLTAARALVGKDLLQFDPKHKTVKLLKARMRLDLGGIAKGYAADEALDVLRQHGITRALVDASGDLALGEEPPGKQGWKIAIAPLREGQQQPERFLILSRAAVATSGDRWQFVVIDGRRYSHIIDPQTGLGLTTPSSVTVVAPKCITADSLASALSVLGPEKGMKLIESVPKASALMVRQVDGKSKTYKSQRFKQLKIIAK